MAYRSGAPVTCSFPPRLDGLYLRKGPNPALVPYEGPYHWFLRDGMLHGVWIQDGKALWHRNLWVRTEALATKIDVKPPAGPPDDAVVDATNFTGKSQAVIKLPQRAPLGFHGCRVPATEAGPV